MDIKYDNTAPYMNNWTGKVQYDENSGDQLFILPEVLDNDGDTVTVVVALLDKLGDFAKWDFSKPNEIELKINETVEANFYEAKVYLSDGK